MSRVYHNCSFKLLIPPHISTQNHNMCHSNIDSGLLEIVSLPDQKLIPLLPY
jgi:hypothetical protein